MKCRSCGRDIVFATYAATGKKMPLDALPNPEGSLQVDVSQPGSFVGRVARYIPRSERDGRTDLHQPHFETCPDAARYRRARHA